MPRILWVSALLVAVPLAFAMRRGPDAAQNSATDPDTAAVRAAVMEFIRAIDHLDLDALGESFSEEATAFYPFGLTPHRLNGRAEIVAAQDRGFTWARQQFAAAGQSEPYRLRLNPTDMQIRMLGSDAAVVTWHSHRPTHAGRRTSVLERVDGRWRTVSHHASNMARD